MLRLDSGATAEERLDRFLRDSFGEGGYLPCSFRYRGVSSREILKDWKRREADGAVEYIAPDGMTARVEIKRFEDFPAAEWLLTFENRGKADSGILSEVNALDAYVEMAPFRTAGTRQYGGLDNILYYSGGSDCKADDFIPCMEILHHISVRQEMEFESREGRPTSGSHGSFPYFNLKTLDQGVFFAIGWSGQWKMKMETRQRETEDGPAAFRFAGGMPGVRTILHPGERIRTARILWMPWKGDIGDARNMSRRFMLKYHTPHVDGRPAVLPLSVQTWGYDQETNKKEIDQARKSGLPFDAFWVDAGWYGPSGTQCANPRSNDWSDHVGWYSHDPSRYPGGLGAVGEYAHGAGMRFLLWLEPDRAVVGTPTQSAHPEYYMAHPIGNSRLLNLGREDAYEWALGMLTEKIEKYRLDILRIDYNAGQAAAWEKEDGEDRQGMTQIRCVENFYRLWDELLRRFPHLLIDNCASGGRRLDFEANSRSVSLFRTDYLCYADCDPVGMQCQTAGLAPFVPLNGVTLVGGMSWYRFISFLTAGLGVEPETIETAMETEEGKKTLQRMLYVYTRARPILAGDFYLFTAANIDQREWFAYEAVRPETGEAFVVSARRRECPMTAACYQLKGLDRGAVYALEDGETGDMLGDMTGEELMEKGLRVALDAPESAKIVLITKK